MTEIIYYLSVCDFFLGYQNNIENNARSSTGLLESNAQIRFLVPILNSFERGQGWCVCSGDGERERVS